MTTTLVSAGVSVTVDDESFYTSTAAGTIPLIVFATASNKTSSSGTGTAAYTTTATAGRAYTITSQRQLLQNYGNPKFTTLDGTTVYGDELNEFGLHAAYTYLGISGSIIALRADLDTAQLAASATAPTSKPASGTYWFDTASTSWGLFQSNGANQPVKAWASQVVKVPTASDITTVVSADSDSLHTLYPDILSGLPTPKANYGSDGDFAVVTEVAENFFFEKVAGSWYRVGSPAWKAAHPTTLTGVTSPAALSAGDSFSINGTTVHVTDITLSGVVTAIINAAIANVTATIVNNAIVIANTVGGSLMVSNVTGTPLATLGLTAGFFKGIAVNYTADASYPTGSAIGDVWFKGTSTNKGAAFAVKLYSAASASWTTVTPSFYADDSTATAAMHPVAGSLYVQYNTVYNALTLRRFDGTQWDVLSYEAASVAPTGAPAAGTYWYCDDFAADILCGNGTNWLGYKHAYPETDPMGVIIAGSAPALQSDQTALVDNDIWLDSSDTENYPALYRYSALDATWVSIDTTDQTSPEGIVFADARADSGVTFTGITNPGAYSYSSSQPADLVLSDFLDPDAPDARTYPAGMLLFNTRASTYNVKQWLPNYFLKGNYDANTTFTATSYYAGGHTYSFPPLASTGRWVTASGNKTDGSPYMGRKAQRALIVKAMAAAVANNDDIRSESVAFNLIAAPGYPEMLDDLITFNDDINNVAFVVGDAPQRLAPDTASVTAWGTNAAGSASTDDTGLTAASDYAGIYYPWGFSTNVDGASVMIPPSTMALYTIAYSDSVSYPWLAPAGFTRGLVQNASSVGYLTSEGEYKSVLLSQSQRDALYQAQINPIAHVSGRGYIVYGQKTLAQASTALDRINVARLVNYLVTNLDIILKPYLFEPNVDQTRTSAKLTVERFLNQIVSTLGIDDYAVVCDTSNNTPDTIDQNQLWVDIAIKPTKAVEFIYVPVRLVSEATDLTGTASVSASTSASLS